MTTLLDKLYKTFVGIEFKDNSIILTCLKDKLSGIKLLSSSVFPLKEGDDDKTIAEINSFIARYVRGAHEVFVSIPHKWSIMKFIDVPLPKGKGKDALMNMMQFEIERHIPYQIEDIFFDFHVVEKGETTSTVVFAAVPKGKVDYIREFLEKILFKPQIITISSLAVLNAIEFSRTTVGGWHRFIGLTKKPDIWKQGGKICISLFFGKDNIYFALLKDGSCVQIKSSSRNLNAHPDVLVDDILSELAGLIPGGFSTANKLILSGDIASSPGISDALGAKLGINVEVIDILSKFPEKIIDAIPSIGACYSGLEVGGININLLPHRKVAALKKTGALITKISGALILLLIIGIFAGGLINDRRALKKIEEKFRENEPKMKIIERLSADINTFQQQRDFLAGVRENDIAMDILSELTEILPADVWLTDFNYRETANEKGETSKAAPAQFRGELIISGYATSSSALISILEDSPFFEKVEFVGPIRKEKNKEGFKIKAVTLKAVEFRKETAPGVKSEELKGVNLPVGRQGK